MTLLAPHYDVDAAPAGALDGLQREGGQRREGPAQPGAQQRVRTGGQSGDQAEEQAAGGVDGQRPARPGQAQGDQQAQRRTDGGAWTTMTLASSSIRAAGFTVPLGHRYEFRVRATDRSGNVGTYVVSPVVAS